jgi:hypothetical protein
VREREREREREIEIFLSKFEGKNQRNDENNRQKHT